MALNKYFNNSRIIIKYMIKLCRMHRRRFHLDRLVPSICHHRGLSSFFPFWALLHQGQRCRVIAEYLQASILNCFLVKSSCCHFDFHQARSHQLQPSFFSCFYLLFRLVDQSSYLHQEFGLSGLSNRELQMKKLQISKPD